MIEPANSDLSVSKQRRLPSISRSSFYFRLSSKIALNLAVMRQIDDQFLDAPFFGVRQMT